MSAVNDIAAGILKGLFFPIFLLGDYTNKRRQAIRQGYRSMVPEPHLLNKSRARALTLPLPSGPTTRQRTYDQSQCHLLDKLPLEIRQIIWIQCLGGMKVHVAIRDRRLRRLSCSSSDPKLCHETCWTARRSSDPKLQLLALLLSCRQVYKT